MSFGSESQGWRAVRPFSDLTGWTDSNRTCTGHFPFLTSTIHIAIHITGMAEVAGSSPAGHRIEKVDNDLTLHAKLSAQGESNQAMVGNKTRRGFGILTLSVPLRCVR